jgi:hypothetical protein
LGETRKKGRDHHQDVNEWKILKWILKKLDVMVWIKCNWLRTECQRQAIVNAIMNLWVP